MVRLGGCMLSRMKVTTHVCLLATMQDSQLVALPHPTSGITDGPTPCYPCTKLLYKPHEGCNACIVGFEHRAAAFASTVASTTYLGVHAREQGLDSCYCRRRQIMMRAILRNVSSWPAAPCWAAYAANTLGCFSLLLCLTFCVVKQPLRPCEGRLQRHRHKNSRNWLTASAARHFSGSTAQVEELRTDTAPAPQTKTTTYSNKTTVWHQSCQALVNTREGEQRRLNSVVGAYEEAAVLVPLFGTPF